jgi:tryptophan-rich sensory protein
MERLFVILFLIGSISATILYWKFPGNTKQGIIVRLCWFMIMMPFSFIFLSENATMAQNIVLGIFAGGGLVYFFYKFKKLRQQANH